MSLKKTNCRVTLLPNPCNMVNLANQWISNASVGSSVSCLDSLMDDLILVVALYDIATEK